ncbi:MAG TPA: phosphoglycerate dehydrogenase, partial [Chloroflexota bacterium]|nr:phosphoglycerate dehydrogenase [Chloroflexota bacterium]
DALSDADALIVRSAVQVTAPLLERARKLRVIGRAGVGVDNIDLEAATRSGIAVMNTPGANAVAVAEHTFALMLAVARHLCRAHELTRAGRWEKKSLQGTELRGKTLGIVGLGRIGVEVARRAKGFGMEVLAHDPYVAPSVADDLEIRLTKLEEVFAKADYLSLHVGLTPQTQRIINAQSLARMKKGVRLINCARGELVDEAALAAALRSGQVAAAGLDVFSPEPPKDSPLVGLDNVVLTPHIAGSTREAQELVGYQIARQVKEYLRHGVIQNAVNIPSVSHEEYMEMQPWIVLSERLGSFLAQTTEGNLEQISLRYSGRCATWTTDLLRNAAIKGVLNQMLSDKANLVNAASIAAERDIRVRETKKPKPSTGGAPNVISILLATDRDQRLVTGAVLHEKFPRLLAVDNIDVEAPLERNLVYLRNRDVPGVIGKVGTILGNHKINIANFSLGRSEQAARVTATGTSGTRETKPARVREAIAVVHVDTPVPEPVLAELRAIDAVKAARAVRL